MDLIQELLSSSSSSSESESDSDILTTVTNIIAQEQLQDLIKNENFVEDTVPGLTEKQFIEHFRLSTKLVERIKIQFEESDYYPKKDTGFEKISAFKCILAFLWFACNEAATFRDVADRFNMSTSTLHSIVNNVTRFLSAQSGHIITWPSKQECVTINEEFSEMGFPGAIGCIDGTHIRIDTPHTDPDSYYNRKKFHSIHMQVVCDRRRKIRDVFIGYPGSVHDARVFRNSPLGNSIRENCGEWYILGDSAYPCLRNLLTPYKDNGNLSEVEKRFNNKLSHCRILIEHTIGLLKQRFRQLYHIKSKNVEFICHFIRACCVLHNMLQDDGEMEEEEEEEEVAGAGANQEEEEIMTEDDHGIVGLTYRNYVASILNV